MGKEKIIALFNKRELWVESTKDNNFDSGINNLLIELYPDNAHFIYELLQNAEDAQATEVTFELKEDELKFTHDGRVFDENDLNGITSIGNGTKANDINKIGKFGVGFKAVFTYTSNPKIYSGEYNFQINNLVVPHEIEPLTDNDSTKTVMIFPFNNPKKSKEKAFSEIKKGLRNIHDNTLLFLNNIEKIHYSDNNSINNSLIREEITSTEVLISNKDAQTSSKWLRFKKFLPESNVLFVSVAFKIEIDAKTQKEIIVPINGEVSIYFPAEKESSKLNFHIHAPFSSTVARDSIKDIEENNQLRDLISNLLVESLEYIKEKQFLNFDFLKVLPIQEDHLTTFYAPILSYLINAFNTKNLIAAIEGGEKIYLDAKRSYRSSNKIKQLITKEDLNILAKNDSVYWILNPRQLNSREDKFLKQLNITELIDEKFIDILNNHISSTSVAQNLFFYGKNNEWFEKFYELLYDIENKSNLINKDIFKTLIKLKSGKMNTTRKNCHFESSSKYANSDFIVEPETYQDSNKAKSFLEQLGVKTIDLQEKINLILNRYDYNNFESWKKISKTKHLEHWKIFLEYYKIKPNSLDLFKDKIILFNENKELTRVNKILLSEPYIDNNLYLIEGMDGCHILCDYYIDLPNKDQFLEFIKKLGVLTTIPIKEQGIPYNHPNRTKLVDYKGRSSDYGIDRDYTIVDIESLLKSKSEDKSLLVWKTLIKAEKEKQFAIYRRNKTSDQNSAPSSLIYALKKYEWIPDKNNEFHKPANISQDMLPKNFIYDDSKDWMTAIGLGENIKRSQEEYKKTDKMIQDNTGYTLDLLEAAKNAGITQEAFEKFIAQQRSISETNKNPDLKKAIKSHDKDIKNQEENINPAILKNQEEYIKKAQKRLERNLQKSNLETRKKHVDSKIKVGKEETKQFLFKEYKGYCQVCGFTFEQKNKKGKYFESFDWLSEKVSKQKLNIIEAGSSLCLCSRCHAGFKYGDFKASFLDKLEEINFNQYPFDDFIIKTNIIVPENEIPQCYDIIEMDMCKIKIRLFNKEHYIFYTEEHFLQFFNLMCLKN